jgi:tRNA-splicing ligase RtcB (3'-phosphate/5'-hydroxy nucleic acid ligase)
MIFGTHDENTIQQLQNCVDAEPSAIGVLCADGHLGYSMPIGGVVAYRDHISPSGVGYDIACGNMAVKTDVRAADVDRAQMERIADEISKRVSFGIGRANAEPVDDPVFEAIVQSPVIEQRALARLAQDQLGTVGSGNHYVDVLVDQDGWIWIGVHFGSRGFGHKTATMFMNVANDLPMDARSHDGEMMSPPLLLPLAQPSGQDYIAAMTIAGEYAYAGRRHVVARVLEILGAKAVDTIHNHHNFAWQETHGGESYWVVRKGATPAFPGQRGFVGGSMGDISVILRGVESDTSAAALYSTVHGAGRVMSRRKAKGKTRIVSKWKCQNYRACSYAAAKGGYHKGGPTPTCPQCGHKLRLTQMEELLSPGLVDFAAVTERLTREGLILRGAGADEAPEVYRSLRDVLASHAETIHIETTLTPIIVVMAGHDTFDPYKD